VSNAAPGRQLSQAAEAALVALARAGDEASFAELVRRRQGWLRSLLRQLSRDAALADDLAQDALLQAWRMLPSLRSPAAFGSWLRRLAVSVWLQHVRRHREERLERPERALAGDPRAERAEDPSVQLDLDTALARLAPECRLCVVLAYHERMSHAEINAATGLPLGTVKSHVRRGGEQLRRLLQPYRLHPASSTSK
jgi:RNA polymerase sigma-70 factor, ECF subfamily